MTSTPPEFPGPEKGTEVSPRGQEVEYALVLSRIIDKVKDDPAQLRWTIYEFARARLKIDSAWLDRPERARLANALETAIEGVEAFSARTDDAGQLPRPATLALGGGSDVSQASTMLVPASADMSRDRTIREIDVTPEVSKTSGGRIWGKYRTLPQFAFAGMLTIAIIFVAFIYQRSLRSGSPASQPAIVTALPSGGTKPAAQPSDVKTGGAAAPASPGIPLPTVYGVYALNGGELAELEPLSEQVPDKRVAMSTPVMKPSRTTVPDGKVTFVVYRRDLADNSPERVDVRVVARVTRTLMFSPSGKGSFTPVNDAWNIRNVSYGFRVRPVPGTPEMLMMQPEKADFLLPAGRYVLVLKNQGYDFTVAGKVTDPAQCLERTEAANGMFFSECQTQ